MTFASRLTVCLRSTLSAAALVSGLAGCQLLPQVTVTDGPPPEAFQAAAPIAAQPKAEVIRVPVPIATQAPIPVTYTKPLVAKPTAKKPVAPEELVKTQNANATRTATSAEFTSALQTYSYIEGDVYKVFVAMNHVTSVMLQPGETLISRAGGDTTDFLFAKTKVGAGSAERTIIMIKPKADGIETNVQLNTDRRFYDLAVATVTAASFNHRIAWTYPEDDFKDIEEQAGQSAAKAETTIGDQIDLRRMNMNYVIETTMGKSPRWKPTQVFDDGQKTYIAFPPDLGTIEAPPLFILHDNDDAQIVNYRPRGSYYVVDRLFDVAELRLGRENPIVVRMTRKAN